MSKSVKLGEIFKFEPRSKLKIKDIHTIEDLEAISDKVINEDQLGGIYPEQRSFRYYTSGEQQNMFTSFAEYDGEALIIGMVKNLKVYYDEKPFSTSPDCLVIRLRDRNSFKTKFIYYYLKGNTNVWGKYFGGDVIKRISLKDISNIEIPKFTIERQNELIDYFDNIYLTLDKRKESLEVLDKYLTNSFLKINDDSLKSAADFKSYFIKDIVEDIKVGPPGQHLKKNIYRNAPTNIKYKIYSHKHLSQGLNAESDYVDETFFNNPSAHNYRLRPDDILATRLGIMGKAIVVPHEFEDGIINSNLFRLRLKQDKILPEYFHSLFQSALMLGKLKSSAQGTTIQSLSKEKLETIEIRVPPIEKQKDFIGLKFKVLIQKRLLQDSLNVLERFLASVIYFTFNPEQKTNDEIDDLMGNKIKLKELLNSMKKPVEDENSEISEFQYLEGIENLFKILDKTAEERKKTEKNDSRETYERGISQKLDRDRIILKINED